MKLFFRMILVAGHLVGCGSSEKARVFYLNSYHPGYASSDSIEAAIHRTLSRNITLKRFYLDGKRRSGKAGDSMAKKAAAAIASFDPHLVIASDDDAVQKVVVPYLRHTKTPVVFCGVNWSADAYQLSSQTTTGMLEVLPLAQTIDVVKTYFPGAKRLAVLSENSVSEQNNTRLLDTLYRRLGLVPEYKLVADFPAWKKAFLDAMQQADLIYLPTNGAIAGWNKKEAVEFVAEHIRKPVITCDDFMMPYAVIGFTKVAAEQGRWASHTAMRILAGEKPNTIPVTANREQRGWWNPALAKKIGFQPDAALLQTLQTVQ